MKIKKTEVDLFHNIKSYFSKKFTFDISSTPLMFDNMKDIYELNKKWIFDFDVYLPTKKINLQRPLVWTLEQKQKFIELIINCRINTFSPAIPSIFVIKYMDRETVSYNKIEVIDWKQRLNTIIEFIDNKFPLNIFWKELYYKDLDNIIDKERNTSFANAYFDCEFITAFTINVRTNPITDEDKIRLFEMINWTWTPQDLEHIKKLKDS